MSFLNKKSGVVRRVAAVAILGIGITACGGDDAADEPAEEEAATEEVAEEPAAEEPTGDPIKLMTVTTLNANGPTYENIKIAAEIAADQASTQMAALTAGHLKSLSVTNSLTQQLLQRVPRCCRRRCRVSSWLVHHYFAEAIVPVVAESDITWFGACCPISPSELTSPHSFNIGNQPMYAVGMVRQAVEDGCEAINAVIVEGADAIFQGPMENAMSAYGREFNDVMIIPNAAPDYSAEVAQATTGVDCMVIVLSEGPFLTWNTAMQQSGSDVQQYGPQGNLNSISAVGAEEVTDGNIISGMYPDISTEPWADYRAALEKNNIDQEANDFNSLAGL